MIAHLCLFTDQPSILSRIVKGTESIVVATQGIEEFSGFQLTLAVGYRSTPLQGSCGGFVGVVVNDETPAPIQGASVRVGKDVFVHAAVIQVPIEKSKMVHTGETMPLL